MAHLLETKGFNNVAALLGGFGAWERAGFPTETASGTPLAAPTAKP